MSNTIVPLHEMQEELESIYHRQHEDSIRAEQLRKEIRKLYGSTLPDDVKEGVCLKLETRHLYHTVNNVIRVDFIDVYVDDQRCMSNIRVHGYGVTTDTRNDAITISNDSVGLLKDGDYMSKYEIISDDEFMELMEKYTKQVIKPINRKDKNK